MYIQDAILLQSLFRLNLEFGANRKLTNMYLKKYYCQGFHTIFKLTVKVLNI